MAAAYGAMATVEGHHPETLSLMILDISCRELIPEQQPDRSITHVRRPGPLPVPAWDKLGAFDILNKNKSARIVDSL